MISTKPQKQLAAIRSEDYSPLRWLMVSFAFMATIINYLDRQVLSVVVAAPDFK